MNDDLLDKLYEFEWELRDKLTGAVNIPILGITAVGSLAATIALDTHFDGGVWSSIVAAALVLVALSLSYAVWCVVSTLLTKAYLTLPTAGLMASHYANLLAWNRANHGANAESVTQTEFAAELRQRKISAVDRNSAINEARANGTRLATIGVVASLAFCGISAVGYFFLRDLAPDPIYKVVVTNSKCTGS